jgi:hypothetical protein
MRKSAFNKKTSSNQCHRTKPASEIFAKPPFHILQAPGSALEGKQKVDLSERENPSKPPINHKNAFGLKTNLGHQATNG